jgi:hypothetical protein
MAHKLPMNSDDSTTAFIRRISITRSRFMSRIMYGVRSCRLGSTIVLMSFRTVLYSMNLCFAKVKTSWRFATVIIPWSNCGPDAGQTDLDGSTERYIITRLSKGSESKIRDRATVVFCFTSHFVFHQNRIEIVWPYWNLFLLTCDWAEQINPHWVFIGQLRGIWWIVMCSVNEGGSNLMYGSLLCTTVKVMSFPSGISTLRLWHQHSVCGFNCCFSYFCYFCRFFPVSCFCPALTLFLRFGILLFFPFCLIFRSLLFCFLHFSCCFEWYRFFFAFLFSFLSVFFSFRVFYFSVSLSIFVSVTFYFLFCVLCSVFRLPFVSDHHITSLSPVGFVFWFILLAFHFHSPIIFSVRVCLFSCCLCLCLCL